MHYQTKTKLGMLKITLCAKGAKVRTLAEPAL